MPIRPPPVRAGSDHVHPVHEPAHRESVCAAGAAGRPRASGSSPARAAPAARRRTAEHASGYRVPGVSNRVLVLSWEYPPVIEGGLARRVRMLVEGLVRQGVTVDVLTRGRDDGSASGLGGPDQIDGLTVHRVREPGWPRDLDRFVAWVQRMNDDMLAA